MFRKLAISFAAIAATVGFTSVAAPAHADVNISGGVYQFSNFQQYLTNPHGVVVGSGDESITFTSGADPASAIKKWELTSHGRVTASGDTFTPGSGLNAAFNNYTIWELQNEDGPYAGGCTGTNGWQLACLNSPPNNYFIIGSLGGNNYYLVNVHASNLGYAANPTFTDTPYLLTYVSSGAQAQYREWPFMGSISRPSGSTLTAHNV
jgi:hypothetical protein